MPTNPKWGRENLAHLEIPDGGAAELFLLVGYAVVMVTFGMLIAVLNFPWFLSPMIGAGLFSYVAVRWFDSCIERARAQGALEEFHSEHHMKVLDLAEQLNYAGIRVVGVERFPPDRVVAMTRVEYEKLPDDLKDKIATAVFGTA